MAKTSEVILYLSKADIAAVHLEMDEIIEIVEEVFREKAKGAVEMPPKPGIHPKKDAFIHAMPAYVPAMRAAAVKWVSGYPENAALGLPYISGLLVLNDPENGLPIAVMEAGWITAMRTGAASAVAARKLVKPNPRTLSILGCGVQGRSHVEALTIACPTINHIKAFDISERALETFLTDMRAKYSSVKFEAVNSPREAVDDADIIVTAGPIKKISDAGIEAGWTKKGVFASPVDFDTYWSRQALREFDKILTDDVPQFQYYRQQGYFQEFPELCGDIADVVNSDRPLRASPEERVMSVHLGLAIEDAAVARRLFDAARKAGIGHWLER